MRINGKKLDFILFFFLIIIMGGVPFGIRAYDYLVKSQQTPEFRLLPPGQL